MGRTFTASSYFAKIAYNPNVVNENWFFFTNKRSGSEQNQNVMHIKIKSGMAMPLRRKKRSVALADLWNSVFSSPALSILSRNHALHGIAQRFDGIRLGHHTVESVFPELGHDGMLE
jgi:hypothetical protein